MEYEHIWAVVILGWTTLWLTWNLVRRWMDRRHEQRLRNTLHVERLAAIEQGQPIPEVLELGGSRDAQSRQRESQNRRLLLTGGILAVALGLGAILGFWPAQDPDLHQVWSLGFIPLSLGGGLLLLRWLP